MQLRNGEQFDMYADPMLMLMARECENVEDEMEFESQVAARESMLLAAQSLVRNFNQE